MENKNFTFHGRFVTTINTRPASERFKMPLPSFRGVDGSALCGCLLVGETPKQFIKRRNSVYYRPKKTNKK